MKFRSLLMPLLVSVQLFASEDPQNAGRTQFYLRSSSAFNVYTNSPSTSLKSWMSSHFWRFQSSSPYFDSRLSWMPNAWAYLDLYGIKTSSPLVSQHPDWILHDAAGNRLYIPFDCANGTCPNYAGDMTNSKFRSWWIANAQSIFAKGYKGFWIDDVNMDFRVSNGNGSSVIPHDSDTGTTMTAQDWRRYIAEFTEQIRAALPTAQLVHNAIWFASPTRYSDPYVIREIKAADYINCERGVSDPGLVGGTGDWSVRAFLDYVDAVHSYGKNVLMDEYAFNGDYGLAGYYLISNGDDAIGNQQITPDNWWTGYDVNLGTPLGARYDWHNLIRRDFLYGMVLLNPPKTTAITVTLPTALTKIVSGTSVTSVTLQPGQAVVLTGAVPIPDYSLTVSPETGTVAAGSTATYTAHLNLIDGFAGTVALTASGLPSGASASFSHSSISGSTSSTLSIATSASTPAGTYTITVTGTSGSLRHSDTVTLAVSAVSVNLTSSFVRSGVYNDGSTFSSGGLDGNGFAYSKNLIGTTKTLSGVPYTFGAANTHNVVTGSAIALPAGKYSTLHFAGTAVNGNQASQKFTVSYTDGTTSTFTQSMSDWVASAKFSGETTAMAMTYRNTYSGSKDKRTFNLYTYSFAINKSKTVKSFTLPNNSDVLILAVTLVP